MGSKYSIRPMTATGRKRTFVNVRKRPVADIRLMVDYGKIGQSSPCYAGSVENTVAVPTLCLPCPADFLGLARADDAVSPGLLAALDVHKSCFSQPVPILAFRIALPLVELVEEDQILHH